MAVFDFSGYVRVFKDKSISRFGGLTTYVRDDIEFNPINVVEQSNILESLFVEITLKNSTKKLLLGNFFKKCTNYNVS